MPNNRWLSEEYIKEKLFVLSKFVKRVNADEFKLFFFVPVEDEKICKIAKELGFRVLKTRKIIVLKVKKK